MIIGVVSDSHDNLPLIDKAVQTLNLHKTELVLHAGDYVSPFTIAHFAKLNCPLIGVFGNNDGDREFLKQCFNETKNCTVHGRFTTINADGYRIALMHGHETELLNAIIDAGTFNAVVHGHSHNKGIRQLGKTLTVNPGELCGYLTGKPTVAVLNTVRNVAEIVEL